MIGGDAEAAPRGERRDHHPDRRQDEREQQAAHQAAQILQSCRPGSGALATRPPTYSSVTGDAMSANSAVTAPRSSPARSRVPDRTREVQRDQWKRTSRDAELRRLRRQEDRHDDLHDVRVGRVRDQRVRLVGHGEHRDRPGGGQHHDAASTNGMILARAGRPRPNAARRLVTYSDAQHVGAAVPRPLVVPVADVVDRARAHRGVLRDSGRLRSGRSGLEDLLDAVAALLHPDQPQSEVGDAVADQVVGRPPRRCRRRGSGPPAGRTRPAAQVPAASSSASLVHLDGEDAAGAR